jgi:hypothetical protein
MLGNVLDMKSVLQDIEGRKSVTMVRNWSLHLGLVTTLPGTLIHVMKKLAGTGLLHFYWKFYLNPITLLPKFIAKDLLGDVSNPEKSNYFHHFENCVGSCSEYWIRLATF